MNLKSSYNQIKFILGPEYQEPFEVVKNVELYRQYWKPDKVKTILLAESHVYTTWEDFQEIIEIPHSILPNYPKNYVRFIYCLNYGSEVVGKRIKHNKGGTPQFWKIFFSSLHCVKNNTDFEPTRKFEEKLKILWEMKERGIWLVDASICGLYIPGGSKPNQKKVEEAVLCSWNGIVKHVVEECQPERLVVIGKKVWGTISPFLSSKLKSKAGWVYQPNARLKGDGHLKNYQKLYNLCHSGLKLDIINKKKLPSIKQNEDHSKMKNINSPIKKPKITYEFYRLGFRAKKIEPLNWTDSFRIKCPDGTFQMTKSQFYEDFENVVKSKSYQNSGIYHYPKTPQKAYKYII